MLHAPDAIGVVGGRPGRELLGKSADVGPRAGPGEGGDGGAGVAEGGDFHGGEQGRDYDIAGGVELVEEGMRGSGGGRAHGGGGATVRVNGVRIRLELDFNNRHASINGY